MRAPLTPGMLRHAADMMEGRAAGMKIMATPCDGAPESGLPIGPTLRSLAYYILARLGAGWKLRLVHREKLAAVRAQTPEAIPTTELSPAEESTMLRHVAELLDGAAKGKRVIVTCPDGTQHRCVSETGKLLNLLRVGCTLHLEGPPKKVPFTRDEMSKLAGRVLVWPDYEQLCSGAALMHGGYCVHFADRAWMAKEAASTRPRSAQQLLDESVFWRDVGDAPEGAKLHPCWTVTS